MSDTPGLDRVRTTAQIADVLAGSIGEVRRLTEMPEEILPKEQTLRLLEDLSYAAQELSLRVDALERQDRTG